MKCQVVFDKHGSIVSARYLELPVPEVYDYLTPRFGPVAGEGQTVAEIEVPDPFERLPLTDLVARLNVDIQAKQPTLVAKKQCLLSRQRSHVGQQPVGEKTILGLDGRSQIPVGRLTAPTPRFSRRNRRVVSSGGSTRPEANLSDRRPCHYRFTFLTAKDGVDIVTPIPESRIHESWRS